MEHEVWWDADVAAKYLSCPPKTIQRMARFGEIKSAKLRRRCHFREE